MMLATEIYIKQIINNTKPITKSALSKNPSQYSSTLTINDLFRTTTLHPSLLGDDFLLQQEHLAFTLM